jgi:hypothetical protein
MEQNLYNLGRKNECRTHSIMDADFAQQLRQQYQKEIHATFGYLLLAPEHLTFPPNPNA